MTATTARITARDARKLVGCIVHHDGEDHRIEDVRHMGLVGWMLRLSSGALLKPSEIR